MNKRPHTGWFNNNRLLLNQATYLRTSCLKNQLVLSVLGKRPGMFGNEFSKRNGNGNLESTEIHGNGIQNIPVSGITLKFFWTLRPVPPCLIPFLLTMLDTAERPHSETLRNIFTKLGDCMTFDRKPFDRKTFDRKSFDRKPLDRKGHLTENQMTELDICPKRTFDRKSFARKGCLTEILKQFSKLRIGWLFPECGFSERMFLPWVFVLKCTINTVLESFSSL